jgi:hypothetical protein
MAYNNNYKKPKTLKGYITGYEVSDLVKNDWVDQKDYFHHIITIKQADDTEEKFFMVKMTDEKVFEEGTYVAFRYKADAELKKSGIKHKIEAKSFSKTMTPEELAEFQKTMNASQSNTEAEKPAASRPRRRGPRG